MISGDNVSLAAARGLKSCCCCDGGVWNKRHGQVSLWEKAIQRCLTCLARQADISLVGHYPSKPE